MPVTPSVRFVLDVWYEYVQQAKALGFTPAQARALASMKQRWYASEGR